MTDALLVTLLPKAPLPTREALLAARAQALNIPGVALLALSSRSWETHALLIWEEGKRAQIRAQAGISDLPSVLFGMDLPGKMPPGTVCRWSGAGPLPELVIQAFVTLAHQAATPE